jgi:hypothetical protein
MGMVRMMSYNSSLLFVLLVSLWSMEGDELDPTPCSCSQIAATSVAIELTFPGFILTSFPSVCVEIIGWEG